MRPRLDPNKKICLPSTIEGTLRTKMDSERAPVATDGHPRQEVNSVVETLKVGVSERSP
jgi:hypothetical protein